MSTYGIISDTHHHNWTAFSSVDSAGINTRLRFLLDETLRAASEVKAAGGKRLIHTGDLFHVRGSIAPSVLNPTLDTYREIIASGVEIILLAGNHDLESRESNRLGSAITALEGIGCKVVNSASAGLGALDNIILVPWVSNIEELRDWLEKSASCCDDPSTVDLLMHAPLDGVIPGLPAHGLDPAWVAKLGFRRVFSGHYHHHKLAHKPAEGESPVYSVGAIAHHNWSDVNSKAGFLLVTDDEEVWRSTRAPLFVEIDGDDLTDPDRVRLAVDGNYARVKLIGDGSSAEVAELRRWLIEDCKARGVTIVAQRDVSGVGVRSMAVKRCSTMEESVAAYVDATMGGIDPVYRTKLLADAANLLTKVREGGL